MDRHASKRSWTTREKGHEILGLRRRALASLPPRYKKGWQTAHLRQGLGEESRRMGRMGLGPPAQMRLHDHRWLRPRRHYRWPRDRGADVEIQSRKETTALRTLHHQRPAPSNQQAGPSQRKIYERSLRQRGRRQYAPRQRFRLQGKHRLGPGRALTTP